MSKTKKRRRSVNNRNKDSSLSVYKTKKIITTLKELKNRLKKINVKGIELTDCCGTGGSKIKKINISTATAVLSSVHVPIAKRGYYGLSRVVGSLDIIKSWGINLNVNEETIKEEIKRYNLTFISGAKYTPWIKDFPVNIKRFIAPFLNPLNPKRHLMGVFTSRLLNSAADIFINLGYKKAMVVHSLEGMDEISPVKKTKCVLINYGKKSKFIIRPRDLKIRYQSYKGLLLREYSNKEKTIFENSRRICQVLAGYKKGIIYDAIALNTAGVLLVADYVKSINEGYEVAKESLDKGVGIKQIKRLILISKGELKKLNELLV